MRGPHPYPERPPPDIEDLRELAVEIEALLLRATAVGSTNIRAGLAMTLGMAREEIARVRRPPFHWVPPPSE